MSNVTYTLELGQHLNLNRKMHWRKKAAIAAVIRSQAARQQWDLRAQLGRAHCTAVLTFRDRTRRDPANWAPTVKPAVDGIVSGWPVAVRGWVGLLPDDDSTHLIGPDLRIGAPDSTLPPGHIRLLLDFCEIGGAE